MVRGTGKFKTKRGGGRQFRQEMVNFALNHFRLSLKDSRRKDADGSGSDEEEEEEESEEESEEEEEEAEEADKSELSRAERKELKKKQAAEKMKQKQKQAGGGGDDDSDDDSDLINPNHVKSKMNISDLSAPRELSRKEREAKEKKEAQDKYWKLHVAGKTDQAKADLSRLAKIRADREAAAEKRKAEAEAKKSELEAKQKASRNKSTSVYHIRGSLSWQVSSLKPMLINPGRIRRDPRHLTVVPRSAQGNIRAQTSFTSAGHLLIV
ncbi:pdgfa associated protein 1 [Lentinula edodes]|uniref:Pdgfa associated protein 1 n=1 Tax=Lentinula edodes TaxID=5353 RepID=A0A1Q3E0G1_LENED|nr:pdgfa associated protein 1 [Lentinula edodes]